jgi:hypothetical protein
MEQSPSWETETSWATQETPHILWNTKVRYRITLSWNRSIQTMFIQILEDTF